MKTMGKLSRNKGSRGEREIVNRLKEAGVPCKRISMMETGGIDKGDVELMGVYKGQVKLGKMVPAWLYNARNVGEDFLFARKDKHKWLVVMDLEFFLDKFL